MPFPCTMLVYFLFIAEIVVVIFVSHLIYAGFLGFYNRTCSTNMLPSKTAGPVLRRRGNIWEQWVLSDISAMSEDRYR